MAYTGMTVDGAGARGLPRVRAADFPVSTGSGHRRWHWPLVVGGGAVAVAVAVVVV